MSYICEIHLDMMFYYKWYEELIKFLETSDEPMIFPGIVTKIGELRPAREDKKSIVMPKSIEELEPILKELSVEGFYEWFVNPVIYKSKVLREIGDMMIDF